jgi:hypothetical protein
MSSKFSTKLKTTAAKPCKSKPTPALPPTPPPPPPWPPAWIAVHWQMLWKEPGGPLHGESGDVIAYLQYPTLYEGVDDPDATIIRAIVEQIDDPDRITATIFNYGPWPDIQMAWGPIDFTSPPTTTYSSYTESSDPRFIKGLISFDL